MLCAASSFAGTKILPISTKSKSGLSRFNISFRPPAACVVLWGRPVASRRLSFRPPAACVMPWGRSAASCHLSFRPPATSIVLWGRPPASRRLSFRRVGRRASSKNLIFHKLKPLGLMFSGKCIILQADWHCLPPLPLTQCRHAPRAATA